MGIFTKRSGRAVKAAGAVAPGPAVVTPARMLVPDSEREARILEIGRDLLEKAHRHRGGMFSAKVYQDKLMDFAMKDRNFKVQLFRFVDTFPVLQNAETIHSVLTEYLSQPGVKLPPGMDLGLKAGGVAKGLMAKTMGAQIKGMASNFIAGTDAESALPKLKKLWDRGIAFSVDLLGEACVSDAEADEYAQKYLDLVRNLPETVKGWREIPVLERDHLGVVPRTNVSVKVSALAARFEPIDPERAIDQLMSRLVPILEEAANRGVFINFDMEQAELKDVTLDAFFRAKERVAFEGGLAMQAYLKSGDDDARRVSAWAKETGHAVTVRLVKGAYWDYEVIHAEERGWPVKVWTTKRETDACFERMSEIFLDACPREIGEGGVKLALGSHNARSIAAALEGLDRRGLPREAIELQMLHGMAGELKEACADETPRGLGLRVREYVPVGEMIPGMAYLVRRLLENTSNESWLRAGFADEATPEVLLASPHAPAESPTLNAIAAEPVAAPQAELSAERHELTPAVAGVGDGRAFFNEPPRDFSIAAVREAFGRAVAASVVPEVLNDRTPEQGAEMVARAHAAFPGWRDADPNVRANVLERAAAIMAEQRDALSGIVCKENGKPWSEADADVCEAIDFCRYYARLAPRLFERSRLGKFLGELDELWHQPRGVAVVVAPWNFPIAICCGMTVAAMVTGNTVVVKPAEQTPGIAKALCDALYQALKEAGASGDVLQFCPAPGETTGAALVRDPRVSLIAFTGSKAVGLDIIKAAGMTPEEQPFVKRVVCEMGGKNAVIVDETADLDEAVLGVRYSAFGFNGQKCSACSRCVVVDPAGPDGPNMTAFLRRFGESVKALRLGDPCEPGVDVTPVIDGEAAGKIRGFIERADADVERGTLRRLIGDADFGDRVSRTQDDVGAAAVRSRLDPAWLIAPHVYTHVPLDHELATDEVFGPVLAVMHASSFDDAIGIAIGSKYRLTGGVFTRTPSHIEKAKREFRVGNLYINRGCTGALVARHPFGGFGMSGIGSKAGGPDYLLQFVEPRACAENTTRRGFAPEL